MQRFGRLYICIFFEFDAKVLIRFGIIAKFQNEWYKIAIWGGDGEWGLVKVYNISIRLHNSFFSSLVKNY